MSETTVVELVLAGLVTFLSGWLLTSDEAEVLKPFRLWWRLVINRKVDLAEQARFGIVGKVRGVPVYCRIWFWGFHARKLGCQVCTGLEPSFLAWLALSMWADRPIWVWPVDLLAINGINLLLVKLSGGKVHNGDRG